VEKWFAILSKNKVQFDKCSEQAVTGQRTFKIDGIRLKAVILLLFIWLYMWIYTYLMILIKLFDKIVPIVF